MTRAVRLARSAVWLLLLPILLSARTARSAPGDGDSFQPEQGTVFDGASTARSTWYVDFSGLGFQLEHRIPFFLCPGAPRDAVDEILRVAPEHAVFQSAVVVAVFGPFRSLLHLELPSGLAGQADDCGLLDQFEALQDFLLEVLDRSASVLSQIESTLDALQDAYCRAREAILDAPIVAGEQGGFFPPLGGGGGGSGGGPVPPPCRSFRNGLTALVADVDRMSVKRSTCGTVLDLMEGVPDLILQRTADVGGLTVDEQQLALAGIDAWLAAAESTSVEAAALNTAIASQVATYTLEALTLSCDDCPSTESGAAPFAAGPGPLPGTLGASTQAPAVDVRWSRAPLDRYVRSLWRAVFRAWSRREALRLMSLACRLSALPGCRVLHATWRGSAGLGQEYVALRSPWSHRRRGAPWAVVLTVLPADAPWPDPTPADPDRLFAAIDAFNALVAPASRGAGARNARISPWPGGGRGPRRAR